MHDESLQAIRMADVINYGHRGTHRLDTSPVEDVYNKLIIDLSKHFLVRLALLIVFAYRVQISSYISVARVAG